MGRGEGGRLKLGFVRGVFFSALHACVVHFQRLDVRALAGVAFKRAEVMGALVVELSHVGGAAAEDRPETPLERRTPANDRVAVEAHRRRRQNLLGETRPGTRLVD